MKKRTRLWIRVALFLLLVGASGFAWRQMRHTAESPDLPTAPVRKGDFLVLVRCRGELTARRSEQMIAPLDVPDLQILWMAPEGSAVKAGQTIIKFDPSKTEQDLKEKEVAVQQAQATLDQALAQAQMTADQDKFDQKSANYLTEKARLEASKRTIVSAIQGEESEIDLGLAVEKQKVQQTWIDMHDKMAEARAASLVRLRDAAQAMVELTKHRLALMEMKSPLDGVVNYLLNYSQGWNNAQPFKVGDHAVPGGAVAEIPDLTTLEMESKVDETDRGRIAIGDTVLVHVDALPELVLTAKLVSITPLTEQSFNEWPPTRSFRAFAQIEHPDPRMRPGMNAGADVVESKIPAATSIPAKALFTLNGKPAVYVKSRGDWVATPVRILGRNPDEVAIEGVDPGVQVALAEPPPREKQ